MTMTIDPRILDKLRYVQLREMNHADMIECSEVLRDLIIETLDEHGPLPVEGLEYFIRQRHNYRPRRDDLHLTIVIHDHDLDRLGACYRTTAQAEAGMGPVLPVPDDYAHAYYELLEKLARLRTYPDLLHIPDGLYEDLFGRRNRE